MAAPEALVPPAESSTTGRGQTLAIVIPARNEASRLKALLDQLPAALPGFARVRTIVVDDGSSDGTAALARACGATALRHRVNLGKGGALLTGCDAALLLGADTIVAMDADGQHLPADLEALTSPIADGSCDVVLGVRRFEGDMPALFRAGNLILNQCLKLLFGVAASDSQCGYRAFRAAVYPQLRWSARDYAVESEMLVRMARAHLRWTEVSVATVYLDRFKGTQPSDGLKILRQLVFWRLGG